MRWCRTIFAVEKKSSLSVENVIHFIPRAYRDFLVAAQTLTLHEVLDVTE